MKDLSEFSAENLKRIQKVLKILLDELELKGINRLEGNKIPIEKFEKEELSYNDVLAISKRINEKEKLIRCFSGEYSNLAVLEFYPPENELEKMEFSAQEQVKARRYIIFIVINLGKLKKIKKEIDKIIKDREGKIIKKGGQPIELFTDKIVPGRTAEIEKNMREEQIRQIERAEREKFHNEQMKQNRMLATKTDEFSHALDLIIKRAELNEGDFSIDYYYFNFEDRMDDSKILEKFLAELQNNGCFEKYERTNYAGGTRFRFSNVNIKNLKRIKNERGELQNKQIKGVKNKETKKRKRLIERDEGTGDFYYKNKLIKFENKEAIYYLIFECLYENGELNGFCAYEIIDKYLQQYGKGRTAGEEQMKKRIKNGIMNLFRFSNLPPKTPNGKQIIINKRGKGIVLYNP